MEGETERQLEGDKGPEKLLCASAFDNLGHTGVWFSGEGGGTPGGETAEPRENNVAKGPRENSSALLSA